MSIASGYNKVKDRVLENGVYKLISRWTSANSVEFDDGTVLPDKINTVNNSIDTTNEKIVVINNAMPYTIEIDDTNKTINFIDREV